VEARIPVDEHLPYRVHHLRRRFLSGKPPFALPPSPSLPAPAASVGDEIERVRTVWETRSTAEPQLLQLALRRASSGSSSAASSGGSPATKEQLR
jgi:hypothetical protein